MRQVGFIIVLYIIIGLLMPATKSLRKSALRIVNGRDAAPGEYPYAVRLESHHVRTRHDTKRKTKTQVQHMCTGAAIASSWTLLAAHCFRDDFEPVITNNFSNHVEEIRHMLRYGTPHIKPSKNNQTSKILKLVKPKRHINEVTNDDIALIYTEPISIEIFGKLSGIDYTALPGHEAAIVGFGKMRVSPHDYKMTNTYKLNKPLQVIGKVMLITCDDVIKICAVPMCSKFQATYYGDSGGPVIHASGIIGVLSAGTDSILLRMYEGLKYAVPPAIEILTPVSPHMNWIHSTMNAQ